MLNERLVEALYLPVERRVRRRLRELTESATQEHPLVVPLIQEELADLAGTTRATVNRILREEVERLSSNAAAPSCSTPSRSHAGRDSSLA